MRTSSTKFASVALALAALIAIAEVGPRALGDNELSLSDHGPAPEFTGLRRANFRLMHCSKKVLVL